MSARDAGSAVLLEEGLPASGSDSEGVPGRVVVRGAGRKTLIKLGGGVLALVALGGVVGVALHPRDRIQKADSDQKVEEFGLAARRQQDSRRPRSWCQMARASGRSFRSWGKTPRTLSRATSTK
jgi:hypothetical protein